MAISAFPRVGSFGTAANTFVTASQTPRANGLLLLAVWNTKSGGTADLPTVTGNSLTWTQIATIQQSVDRRLTLFHALGASPTAGALTIAFGGVSQTWCAWQVTEVEGMVSTSAAAAIVQSATNTAVSSTTITVTLAAFADARNRPYVAVLRETNGAIVAGGATYYQMGPDTGNNTVSVRGQSAWYAGGTTTAVTTTTSVSTWAAIALEVAIAAAAPAATEQAHPFIGMLG